MAHRGFSSVCSSLRAGTNPRPDPARKRLLGLVDVEGSDTKYQKRRLTNAIEKDVRPGMIRLTGHPACFVLNRIQGLPDTDRSANWQLPQAV
jgi:hypothetical protein